MPLNVRRFYTSVFLTVFAFILCSSAQVVPTSGDVMRDRVTKAKAFIAVRNYNAAIYELENIRRETGDPALQGVVSVLLMNSYLEQGDYKRASDFLNELYAQQKTTKPNAQANYFAVAGQIVKGARNRIERYRALGLSVSDRTLPLEASNDLERMREVLELVITQAKDVGKEPSKMSDAMALLEEAANSRSMMGRDDYDARRWRDEVSDTREQVASSRSVVINAVNDGTGETVAQTMPNTSGNVPAQSPTMPAITPTSYTRVPADSSSTQMPATMPQASGNNPTTSPAKNDQPPVKYLPANNQPTAAAPTDTAAVKAPAPKSDQPLEVGSLVGYATKQSAPTYPPAARAMRTTGIVKVEVTVDEKGDVADVKSTSGPSVLQMAAKDAVKKWKFHPFMRDGQPVRANGFINFNFSL
jgi:protein TonB